MARRPGASSPRITSRVPQPTTGRGRIAYQPRTPFESRGVPRLLAQDARRAAPNTPAAPAKPAAPAAPASAAAPQYSLGALPPDASYDQAVGLLQRQRDENLTAIGGARSRGLGDYGFTEGAGGTLAFDPNNPFSKAALLKQSYDRSRRSTGIQMAAGGQLYSGAYQNAQDYVNRNELQGQDAMQKALIGFLARNTEQTKQAGTGYELAAAQAYADRVGRFQSNPLYDPAASPEPAVAGTLPAAAPVKGVPSTGLPSGRTLGGRTPYIWGRSRRK